MLNTLPFFLLFAKGEWRTVNKVMSVPYDDEYPLILPDEQETLREWTDRMEDENPGMVSEVAF